MIKQLIDQLKSKEYHTRYPQLLDKSPKTHVLFLGPYTNGTGLYRTIIPYTILNQSSSHSAIINQLIPYSLAPGEKNNNKRTEWSVSDEMIQWADIIVFPTVVDDLTENIKLLKSINKKPNLKFVYDIDDNYHINEPGQDQQKATESRKNILNNMAQCHIVTCTNTYLGNTYLILLNNHQTAQKKQLTTKFLIMPNWMSSSYMQSIAPTPRKSNKIRIGMVLNRTQNQFNDVLSIKKILIEAQKKHKDKIEVVLFGWNGRVFEKGIMKDCLKGVKYSHTLPVGIDKYFDTLHNLHLDFALMPLLETEFNSCKSHHKLLQYAQMGIPAIVSDVLPYNEILAPSGKTIFDAGYLPALKCKTPDDWQKTIDFLIENEAARKNMAQKAKEACNSLFTWDNKTEYLCNVYK